MKKILLFLGVAMLSLSLHATPAISAKKFAKHNLQAAMNAPRAEFSALKAPQAKAPQAKNASGISVKSTDQVAYYANEFQFTTNMNLNQYYYFEIMDLDTNDISYGYWSKAAMDTIVPYNTLTKKATLAFQSNYVISFGINYIRWKEWAEEDEDPEEAAEDAAMAEEMKGPWMEYTYKYDEEEYEGEIYEYYCLKPGKYLAWIGGIKIENDQPKPSESGAFFEFEVKWHTTSNVNAEVSLDNTQATISWEDPKDLPAGSILYVGVYNNDGDEVYSSYDAATKTFAEVTNPFNLEVEEGYTYTVATQYLTADRYEAGPMEEYVFSVGHNPYAPKDLAAEVLEDYGDSVVFTWTTETQPAEYGIRIYYLSGDYLAELGYETGDLIAETLVDEAEVGAALPPGTYNWEIVSYTYDGQYLSYASVYITGPEFTTSDIVPPIIEGYEVATKKGSSSVTISFEVDDNYYDVDDMTFYVSGDLQGEWTTTDGAYTIEDLEVGREYSITVVVADPAGNINEFADVNIIFTAGEGEEEAIDQVIFDIKANKVLRDGQLIIKRDHKAFNVLGGQL